MFKEIHFYNTFIFYSVIPIFNLFILNNYVLLQIKIANHFLLFIFILIVFRSDDFKNQLCVLKEELKEKNALLDKFNSTAYSPAEVSSRFSYVLYELISSYIVNYIFLHS